MRRIMACGALVLVAAAAPLRAQSGEGFLFGAPDARFTLHTGYARAGAGSDLFGQMMSDLTLNKSDFSGLEIGAELAIPLSSRLDLAFQADFAGRSKTSEYRNLIDNNNQPIQQTTSFKRAPITANLRAYLAPTGRAIGKLAWIPAEVVPWVGIGGGVMWYSFQQSGDFVDMTTMKVYRDNFESDGWGPAAQAMGGVDLNLSPRIAFTADLHYIWSRAKLGPDYVGFDKIDLSGVSTTLGFTFRL